MSTTFQLSVDVELKILDSRFGSAWPIPDYATDGSAALDLRAALDEDQWINPGQALLIPSGIAVHVNNPCVASLILPRSGKGHKEGLVLGNGTGLIDSDYQGQLMISACNRNPGSLVKVEVGERIAQLVFIPIYRAALRTVKEFSDMTERGVGGFGSSGRS